MGGPKSFHNVFVVQSGMFAYIGLLLTSLLCVTQLLNFNEEKTKKKRRERKGKREELLKWLWKKNWDWKNEEQVLEKARGVLMA